MVFWMWMWPTMDQNYWLHFIVITAWLEIRSLFQRQSL